MRIVGGTLKGRRFDPPIKHWKTRPTTDYAKEALFNILENEFDLSTIRAIDLFAGTGSITFEFLSRGCVHVTAVEKYPAAVRFIHEKTKEWSIQDHLTVKKQDVRRYLERSDETADIIFADPPYDMSWIKELPEMIFDSGVSNGMHLLVVEHDMRTDYSDIKTWRSTRKYGQSRFSFFQRSDSGS